MADAHTRRLCIEIIHSSFGPLTAKLASVLLTRGRLPLAQLARISELKLRTARAAILALVQHNILWHAKSDDELEMFEINVDECLMRLRFGRFVWLSEQIFGQTASEIIQIILDHGKLQCRDILSLLSVYDVKKKALYAQTLCKLVSASYLKPSTILSHLSPKDKAIQYEIEEKRKITGFPTAKELREAKEVAQARLKREEEEAETVGLKRKTIEQLGPRSNKRKVTGNEDVIDESVYFRVNYDKFNIHIRNTVIEHSAKARFNLGAALVMKATMKATETSQLSISEPRSPPTSVANIALQLSDEANLSSFLVYPSKKVSNLTCLKDYLGMLSSADNPTAEGKASSFVSYGASKVQVEFEVIARRLRRDIVEYVARDKHGPEGLRILRLLLDTGKMDEKQISKVVMLAPKDVRPLLVALSADSLISTQEVPKSADRNPARTFYLWYVDLQKAFSVILGNIYKTLYNVMARRRAEREVSEVSAVLEKCERSDVSQDESLLTRLERDLVKEWQTKQTKLGVLEMRVEEIVFLLKDFGAARLTQAGLILNDAFISMSDTVLNKAAFATRVNRIYDSWTNAGENEDYSSITDVDALLLVAGDPISEEEPMRKGSCFQQWLLGYEFPSTLTLFQKHKVSILCSASKAKILSQIDNASKTVPVEIISRPKGKDVVSDALPRFLALYTSAKTVGTLPKENPSGKLVSEWQALVAEAPIKPELVDVTPAYSSFMSIKDEDEMNWTQTSASLTSTLLNFHVAPKLENILDKETKISHDMFAAQIETRLGSGEGVSAKGPDMKVWSKMKGYEGVDFQSVEFCYPPIIISKSSKSGYDLRYTVESSEDNIAHKGVFLVAFGIRYKSYCTNIGRTFIVDPNPNQEAQYKLLLSLQVEMLSFMKDGVSARDVYQHAVLYVKSNMPDLEKNFVKSIGFGMGIEFRDAGYILSAKNTRLLRQHMVFNLSLGFTGLSDAGGQRYALNLVDTVKIEVGKASLLTDGTKSPQEAFFFLTDDSELDKPKKYGKKMPTAPTANGSPLKQKTIAGKVLRNQTRRAVQDEVHQTAATKLIEHQRELHENLQAQGLAKYSEDGVGSSGKEGKGWKKFQSYKGDGALPIEVDRLRIFVDRKAQTVILPVHGFAVPFHINTIKNASKSDEGDFTYLRINFQTPGQLAGKKEDTPFEDPDATFIRSVSYRSPDGHRLDNIVKQINDLKKEANKREQQKKEMADVIEQASLVELKGRRPVKLPEVFIRPALDGKRLPGEVEIHQNGIRYQSLGSQKVDVLFSNVKHLFFQSCDHELVVIVHLHLRAPIMIGKKKTFDIQFIREASDVQFDETGNRKRKHRYGDEDEIEMEQQERKRRAMLNKEFKAFAEKIAEAASTSNGEALELDIPFRELSFEGVPFRMSNRLQPTTECLVHLTDPPFLVVPLAEIEIASLERVQYGLKQFDLVFIFKDFTKAPLHINSIQSSQMDDVKNWLDSVDIPMSEGPVNLNWGPIMKHINENPFEFFQHDGWSFLGGATGVESDHSEESGSESEFEADPEELVASSSSDEESDYDDSNVSGSDASGSDFGGADDSDEGDDWDELERKAAKADQKRIEGKKAAGSDDSDDDRPKKKSAKANGKSKTKR